MRTNRTDYAINVPQPLGGVLDPILILERVWCVGYSSVLFVLLRRMCASPLPQVLFAIIEQMFVGEREVHLASGGYTASVLVKIGPAKMVCSCIETALGLVCAGRGGYMSMLLD